MTAVAAAAGLPKPSVAAACQLPSSVADGAAKENPDVAAPDEEAAPNAGTDVDGVAALANGKPVPVARDPNAGPRLLADVGAAGAAVIWPNIRACSGDVLAGDMSS